MNFMGTGLFRWFHRQYVKAANVIVFADLAIGYGVPFYSWPRLWREFELEHEAWVRKIVWQLIMAGKVRRDKEGRLWGKK